MTATTARAPRVAATGAQPRPERLALLGQMLSATGRGAVPIRRAFLQTPTYGSDRTRKGPAAALVKNVAALDAYLLIHAMASSSEPYDTWFPSSTWAQVSRMAEHAEMDAAKSRWAKVATKLADAQLIARKRVGNKVNYVLLHESGSGDPYTRPTRTSHGHWFGVPYLYWTQELDKALTAPEKIMLLVALDQPDDKWLPTDLIPFWYGVSESTARRGLAGLVRRGILERRDDLVSDPKSPTGWKQALHYTTVGDWSITSRKAAMTVRRRGDKGVQFTTPGQVVIP